MNAAKNWRNRAIRQADAQKAASPRTAAAILFATYVLPTVTYLVTAARGPYLGDWGDLVSSASVLGIAHPTGYPTYLQILGLPILILPQAWTAVAANVTHALIVGAVGPLGYLLLKELFSLRSAREQVLAAAGAAAAALTPALWREATSAEVYGPGLTLLLLSFIIAARHLKRGDGRTFVLMFFLAGLTFTQHLTYGLLASITAALGASRKIKSGLPIYFAGAAAFILALSSDLYLPLRAAAAPPLSWSGIGDLGAFYAHVTGRQFSFHTQTPTSAIIILRAKEIFGAIWANLGPFALLAPLGAWAAFIKSRRLACAGLLSFAAAFAFVCVYDIMDLESYYLFPVFATAWAALAGVFWLAGELNRKRVISYAVAGALVVGAGAQFALNYHRENKNTFFLREYPRLLATPMGLEALYVASEIETNFPFWFQRYGLSRRPDIELYNTSDTRRTPRELYTTMLANRERKPTFGDYGFTLSLSGGRAAEYGYPAGFVLSLGGASPGEGRAVYYDREALRICRALLRTKPPGRYHLAHGQREALKAVANHGFFYLAQGDERRARAFFEEAVRLAPRVVETRLSHTDFLIATGDYEAAFAEAREAARISPGTVAAYLLASQALEASGEAGEALAWAEKGAAHGPANGRVFATLGRLYLASGRRQDALDALERAVNLGQYDRSTFLTLAQLHRENGELDKTAAVLKIAAAQCPEPAIIRAYGEALAECGRYAEADKEFERATRGAGY